MKELSLYLLDIVQNSIRAEASDVQISLEETPDKRFIMTIIDNGCGMSAESVRAATDPYYTTRTTRNVGMGLPLLSLACEQTGGSLTLHSISEEQSPTSCGTTVCAAFFTDSLNFPPPGDLVGTVIALLLGAPQVDYTYSHTTVDGKVFLSTKEMRAVLGPVSLAEPDVLAWVRESLTEQYDALKNKSHKMGGNDS